VPPETGAPPRPVTAVPASSRSGLGTPRHADGANFSAIRFAMQWHVTCFMHSQECASVSNEGPPWPAFSAGWASSLGQRGAVGVRPLRPDRKTRAARQPNPTPTRAARRPNPTPTRAARGPNPTPTRAARGASPRPTRAARRPTNARSSLPRTTTSLVARARIASLLLRNSHAAAAPSGRSTRAPSRSTRRTRNGYLMTVTTPFTLRLSSAAWPASARPAACAFQTARSPEPRAPPLAGSARPASRSVRRPRRARRTAFPGTGLRPCVASRRRGTAAKRGTGTRSGCELPERAPHHAARRVSEALPPPQGTDTARTPLRRGTTPETAARTWDSRDRPREPRPPLYLGARGAKWIVRRSITSTARSPSSPRHPPSFCYSPPYARREYPVSIGGSQDWRRVISLIIV
jgi:hypothetical protein